MTDDEVRALIRAWIGERTMKAAATSIGISLPWLSMMLSGKRVPSGKVLDVIGVERRPHGPAMGCIAFNYIA